MPSYKQIINKVNVLKNKRQALMGQAVVLRNQAQTLLDSLAKANCPYKKGQIFKRHGTIVFAKMTEVTSIGVHQGVIPIEYYKAPYVLDCRRCSKKGEVKKNHYIFIDGSDIGTKWEVVEEGSPNGND